MDLENLFGLLVWIFIIGSLVTRSKSKPPKKKKQPTPWADMLQQTPDRTAQAAPQTPQRASAPKPAPVQTSMHLPPLVPDMPPATLSPLMPFSPMAPTVHTHLAPDCAVHDAPGSLGVGSSEGKDPCHEEQFAPLSAAAPAVQTAPGLTLDFTGDNLMRAFVMQEVLTRPCDRRPRGYAR